MSTRLAFVNIDSLLRWSIIALIASGWAACLSRSLRIAQGNGMRLCTDDASPARVPDDLRALRPIMVEVLAALGGVKRNALAVELGLEDGRLGEAPTVHGIH